MSNQELATQLHELKGMVKALLDIIANAPAEDNQRELKIAARSRKDKLDNIMGVQKETTISYPRQMQQQALGGVVKRQQPAVTTIAQQAAAVIVVAPLQAQPAAAQQDMEEEGEILEPASQTLEDTDSIEAKTQQEEIKEQKLKL
uniref:Uncharacterized protein n=1 Tax=Romanomermis culicivorax TaxID=13658 RepID=A0A915HUK5_ROMCU